MPSMPDTSIPDTSLDQIFLEARTHRSWLDRPVNDDLLRHLYDLMKMGPTSANASPGRFLFVKSAEAKEKLRPTLAPGNVEKTMRAPVTVVVAYDVAFHEKMPKLFPGRPEMQAALARMSPDKGDFFLVQNASLEAAYLIIAARALGLDCGPMGGFDRARVDETFFSGTNWRSILLINLGYGDTAKLDPRLPRLDFDEACRVA